MSHRKAIILVASLSFLGIGAGVCAAQQQTPPPPQNQQGSIADAARKAREKAKTVPQAKKTYTNDDLSAIRAGGVSTVGGGTSATTPAATTETKPGTPEPKKDETYWRKRFAEARQKIDLAQRELDVLQRELNLSQTQYYSDPNKALQQQYSREDINDKTAKIEAKKEEISQLQKALADLQDELRQAGGQPGWGN